MTRLLGALLGRKRGPLAVTGLRGEPGVVQVQPCLLEPITVPLRHGALWHPTRGANRPLDGRVLRHRHVPASHTVAWWVPPSGPGAGLYIDNRNWPLAAYARARAPSLIARGARSSMSILSDTHLHGCRAPPFRRLKPKAVRRILLVTDSEHVVRAMPLFAHKGVEVLPAPADSVSSATDNPSDFVGLYLFSDAVLLPLSLFHGLRRRRHERQAAVAWDGEAHRHRVSGPAKEHAARDGAAVDRDRQRL